MTRYYLASDEWCDLGGRYRTYDVTVTLYIYAIRVTPNGKGKGKCSMLEFRRGIQLQSPPTESTWSANILFAVSSMSSVDV